MLIAMKEDWYYHIVTPGLIRGAQATYTEKITRELVESGFDDLPQNGSFVLGCVAQTGSPLAIIIRELHISKQTASQLIDMLENRDYLKRAINKEDRRQVTVTLTERGQQATALAQNVAHHIDEQIKAELGNEYLEHTRVVLAKLMKMGR